MDKEHIIILSLVIFATLITLGFVFILFRKVSKINVKDKRVEEVSGYIHSGAMAFLKREYKVIIPFVLGFAVLLTALGFIPALKGAEGVGWQSALCFLVGALFSGIAGWVGMFAATKSNSRTAMKAKEEGMSGALKVVFCGGGILW